MDITWKLLALALVLGMTPLTSCLPQDIVLTRGEIAAPEPLPEDAAPADPEIPGEATAPDASMDAPSPPLSEQGGNDPEEDPAAPAQDIASDPAPPPEVAADPAPQAIVPSAEEQKSPVEDSPVVPSEGEDTVPVAPMEEIPSVGSEGGDAVLNIPLAGEENIPAVPTAEETPAVALNGEESIPVVPFEAEDNGPVVSREEREDETVDETPAALDVLQERIDRTQEIRPCLGRALETQTLVLEKHDAKDSVITFAQEDSFVKVAIPRLQVSSSCSPSLEFELKLQFRTDRPRGLLAFLSLDTDVPQQRVHFYLYLHRGHLAARAVVAGARRTVYSELGGLHDGSFHSVTLTSLCTSEEVTVTVDAEQLVLPVAGVGALLSSLPSLQDAAPLSASLWLGGVDQAALGDDPPKVRVHALHGCLKQVQLLQVPPAAAADDSATVVEHENIDLLLPAARHSVVSGIICKDMCIESNPCPAEARCINHYDHAVCDCSDLEHENKQCGKQDFRMVRLSGGEYVSHRTQSWETRGHKKAHKVSFFFKTAATDSVLVFVRSLHPTEAYFAVGLDAEGKLRAGGSPSQPEIDLTLDQVELSLGEGPLSPRFLSDDKWHQLVIKAHKTKDTIDIDPVIYFGYAPDFNQACLLPLYPGDLQCRPSEQAAPTEIFYFDPSSSQCLASPYSGCGANANAFSSLEECQQSCSVTGLPTYRPYEGCLQRVYVDGVDVLAHQDEPATTCSEEEPTALSLTTSRSHVLLPPASHEARSSLHLNFQFRTAHRTPGVLAQGSVLMADTVDQWKVISNNNSRLTFVLGENILTVWTTVQVDDKNWNDFSLRINNADVALTLNGDTKLGTSAVPFSLISGLTLGGPVGALRSCVRSVEMDAASLDLRYYLDRSHGVVFDKCKLAGPCDAEGACLHGGECSLSEEGRVQCDCSSTEYRGSRCQFAQYPRSCEGYARLGYDADGVYKVDLDGPGPAAAVPVRCSFQRDGARTQVAHNIPEKLDVRKKGMTKDYKLPITYDGLSEDDLVALVDSSSSCEQKVTFDCVRSRLRLSSETWFSSPRMKLNTHFGSSTPAICPCRDVDECDKETVPCNCDLNDGLARRDTGFMRAPEQLPVTAVYFVNDPDAITDKTRAQLTLGDLQCFKQAETEDAISLLDTESFLEYASSKAREELRSIQFAFRTSAGSAVLLHKPSSHPLQVDLRLLLTSENSIELQYTHRSEHLALKFRTHEPLNSASWQHVRIDLSQQQIKVSLNGGATKFLDLEDTFKILGGELYFGGSPNDLYGSVYDSPTEPGLIGCLKDFFLNEDRVTVAELLQQSPVVSYRLGCSLSCDPNRCRNGALCKELPSGQFECECRNPFAEWGDRCENNLNDDSITLLDTDTEMRYRNEFKPVSEEWNPLSQDLTFGFRTRQLQGLILFIMDHVQNLVQIHLSAPNEITVLWNTGYDLQAMTVNTGDLALNRGKLVQLNLERGTHATTLNVLSQGQQFSSSTPVGVSLLQDREYQMFPYGSEVPHPALTSYQHSPSIPSPFLRVLVGGAEMNQMHGRVPGFIGCLSGLKIGSHQIKLTDRSVWSWSNTNYEIGCYSPCQFSNPCQNDGVCLDVFLKNRELLTECDCTSTSYVGEQCDEEIAYRFHGEEYLIFQELYNVFSQSFSLDFAFALDGEQPEEDDGSIRTILTLRDSPDNIDEVTAKSQFGLLAVGLRQSATVLTVVVQWPDAAVNPEGKIVDFDVADYDLSDGFRHHMTASLAQRTLTIQLDGDVLAVLRATALRQEGRPSQEAVVVGAAGDHPLELPDGATAWAPFFGCISNVQVRTSDKKVYSPLQDYDSHANNTQAFTRVGLPHRTQCSEFKPPFTEDTGPVEVDSKVRVAEVRQENFEPLQQEEAPYNDGSGIKMAGKIGGLIVGAVALGVFIYVCKISHKEPKTVTNEIGLIQTATTTDTENSPNTKEEEPLLAESVELQEMKSGANGTSSALKYEKETTQSTAPPLPKSAPPVAAKTVSEAAGGKEKEQEGSPVPPASIVVEKPAEESAPVDAEVQKAREALDLLDPKDLEKSFTKLSESCEDVSDAEQTSSAPKTEDKEDATEVSEAIDTALDAEENKTEETLPLAEGTERNAQASETAEKTSKD